ncbi:MAG: STT3 domain-containing protein [Candidatus Korarchaeota archaeon]|nr:glycosyltransferase family 39 protein [Thermoproteota archaeon]
MRLYEKVSNFFSVFKIPKETLLKILTLAIAIIVGFILRVQPIIRYGIGQREYDTFVQYFAAKLLLEKGLDGMLAYHDFKFWYPYGNSPSSLYVIVPILGVIIFLLLNALGIHVDLLTATIVTPAIMGSLAVLIVYLLGKEIKDSTVGLIAAIITAVSPAYIQRTIAGFFDNEITICFVLLAILFFIRSIKHGKSIDILACSLFSGIVILSWGIWRYLIAIYVVYAVIRIISGTLDNKDRLTLMIVIPISLGIGIIIPRNYEIATGIESAAALIIVLIIMLEYFATILAKIFRSTRARMYNLIIMGGLALSITGALALLAAGKLVPIVGKFASVLNPFIREQMVTYISVAENQPGIWTNFYLAAGPAILFVPPAILAMIEKRTKTDIVLLLLTVTSFYFAASITRYIVLGAPVLAIVVGLGIDYVLSPYARFFSGRFILHKARVVRRYLGERRIPKGEALGVYLIIFLVLSITVIHGVQVSGFYAGYDYTDAERAIFGYLKKYASPNDVVLSWWDYGYRCTIAANVTTLSDNGTGNSTQMGVVGSMLMLPPNKSIILMRMYNVKWILVYSEDLPKAIWMIRIASAHAPMYGISEDAYLNKEEFRYKEPFFYSVLWVCLAYGEGANADTWVRNYGETKLKDKASQFRVESLSYFVLVMKKTEGRSFVKLYRLVWPEELSYLPSFPAVFNASSVLISTR